MNLPPNANAGSDVDRPRPPAADLSDPAQRASLMLVLAAITEQVGHAGQAISFQNADDAVEALAVLRLYASYLQQRLAPPAPAPDTGLDAEHKESQP